MQKVLLEIEKIELVIIIIVIIQTYLHNKHPYINRQYKHKHKYD